MCECIMAAESRISDLEDQLPPLVAEFRSTSHMVNAVNDHADDIENQLRRNNVCIVDLPECSEENDNNDFLEKWLKEIFGCDALTHLFAVELLYRTPTRALPGNLPRPTLARLLHYRDREIVLCLAKERHNIKYNGVPVSFYPDLSAEVQCTRSKFAVVKKRLQRLSLTNAISCPLAGNCLLQGSFL